MHYEPDIFLPKTEYNGMVGNRIVLFDPTYRNPSNRAKEDEIGQSENFQKNRTKEFHFFHEEPKCPTNQVIRY